MVRSYFHIIYSLQDNTVHIYANVCVYVCVYVSLCVGLFLFHCNDHQYMRAVIVSRLVKLFASGRRYTMILLRRHQERWRLWRGRQTRWEADKEKQTVRINTWGRSERQEREIFIERRRQIKRAAEIH